MNSTPKRKDGRSRKRPGVEQQKNVITRAAIPLFQRLGSRNVSISQICQAANITRPTFYKCFPDKHALLQTLYRESVSEIIEDKFIQRLPEAMTGREEIQTALFLVYDAIFEKAALADLLFRESCDADSEAYAIIRQTFDTMADRLLVILNPEDEATGKVFLKAVMFANQWIVHDAILQGVTPKAVEVAKAAGWQLVERLLVGRDEPADVRL